MSTVLVIAGVGLAAAVVALVTSWSRGGFMCASQENGVQCRNEENHGFLLARSVWTQF